MSTSEIKETKRIKMAILLFIIGLFISGITAFPIESELAFIVKNISLSAKMENWINKIYLAVSFTNSSYPFLAYGTDWLAFAHLLFAVLFIGPLINPVKNLWIIQFGMIACILIIPLAFIAGHIRNIPIFWRIIDSSFGVIGFIPLLYSYKRIKQLELHRYSDSNINSINTTNELQN